MSEECEGIRYLSVADLVLINERLIRGQTPDEPIAVIKQNELESAQQRPANHRYYACTDDVITLAAVLAESLALNHCFANANKRTAAAAATVFLLLNGIELTGPDQDFVEIMVALVTREASVQDLENWMFYWHRPFDAYNLPDSDAFERMVARLGIV
ncbi:type II toxin-antitoxin system death-on-curing family toxin [Pseudomonas aeruginosa]